MPRAVAFCIALEKPVIFARVARLAKKRFAVGDLSSAQNPVFKCALRSLRGGERFKTSSAGGRRHASRVPPQKLNAVGLAAYVSDVLYTRLQKNARNGWFRVKNARFLGDSTVGRVRFSGGRVQFFGGGGGGSGQRGVFKRVGCIFVGCGV